MTTSAAVGVIDYGYGNLASVTRAFRKLGIQNSVLTKPEEIGGVSHLVLPGVGHFESAMRSLNGTGWSEVLKSRASSGTPLLGICLGMQLLLESSAESLDGGSRAQGLGLLSGTVEHFGAIGCALRVPHVGWNSVRWRGDSPLAPRNLEDSDFYFVHSFAAVVPASIQAGTCEYGVPFAAVTGQERIWGVQFHPEKSSQSGLQMLQRFASLPC